MHHAGRLSRPQRSWQDAATSSSTTETGDQSMALVNAPISVNIPLNVSTVTQSGVAVAVGGAFGSPAFAMVENEALVQQANQSFAHQFGIV
jgi:hypothetical protein